MTICDVTQIHVSQMETFFRNFLFFIILLGTNVNVLFVTCYKVFFPPSSSSMSQYLVCNIKHLILVLLLHYIKLYICSYTVNMCICCIWHRKYDKLYSCSHFLSFYILSFFFCCISFLFEDLFSMFSWGLVTL